MGARPILCHCGEPLHYGDPARRRVIEDEIRKHGPFLTMWGPGDRWWLVPRHYFALHGPLAVSELAALGFKEVFR